MIWFQMYLLFAVTTAVTAVYELFYPVISNREKKGPVENKFLLYFVFFFMSVLMAPLVLFSCIVPSMGLTFRFFLEENLFNKDQ